MDIAELDQAIRLICPIHGISVPTPTERETWRICFRDEATPEQTAAALEILAIFDTSSRRKVAKSVIISRLSNEQIENALAVMNAKQAERWRAPDQPAVYADDEDVVAVLTAIGADVEAVLAP